MLVAVNESGDRCIAWETVKSGAPFRCPECLGGVILKKGQKKEHHYAHKPPVVCAYGATESQLHLHAKREIYNALVNHPNCTKVALERRLDGVRPDISLRIRSIPVAIEVQCDVIDIYNIVIRTRKYTEFGIHVLWIIPYKEPTMIWRNKEECWVHRIKEWEKFLHSMYFGRLYYWQKKAFVQPVHFADFEIYVEETEWLEDGYEQSAGGYLKTAKTLRTKVPYRAEIHLADCFIPTSRNSFDMKNYRVPACKLWIDHNKKWWY